MLTMACWLYGGASGVVAWPLAWAVCAVPMLGSPWNAAAAVGRYTCCWALTASTWAACAVPVPREPGVAGG